MVWPASVPLCVGACRDTGLKCIVSVQENMMLLYSTVRERLDVDVMRRRNGEQVRSCSVMQT